MSPIRLLLALALVPHEEGLYLRYDTMYTFTDRQTERVLECIFQRVCLRLTSPCPGASRGGVISTRYEYKGERVYPRMRQRLCRARAFQRKQMSSCDEGNEIFTRTR